MRTIIRLAAAVSLIGASTVGVLASSAPAMADPASATSTGRGAMAGDLTLVNMRRAKLSLFPQGQREVLKLRYQPTVEPGSEYFVIDSDGNQCPIQTGMDIPSNAVMHWGLVHTALLEPGESIKVYYGDSKSPNDAVVVGSASRLAG
ncbi:MAG: hypothetical protein H0T78_11130 [Longispora sp.]|nr:hypothetical protein [Longispora sp. (in: high G+C Gram-positive bacteria)]